MKKKFGRGIFTAKKQEDIVFGRVDVPSDFGGDQGSSLEAGTGSDGAHSMAEQVSTPDVGGGFDGEESGEISWGDVLWAFDGANEGELAVSEGSRVMILGESEEWLFVEFEGQRGYVPRAYIEPIFVEPVQNESGENHHEEARHGEEQGAGGGGPPDEFTERKKIAEEILSTEKFFVNCLGYITGTYKVKLEALAADETSGIEKTDIKKMFANIESIGKLNEGLKLQIEGRMNSWGPETKIGDIFSKMAPVLIIYTEYANMYQEGLNYYNREKKKNERFATVCDECKKEVGYDLEHLLIMPVQRVPRYNLLIEDLFKKTPDDHVDKADLGTALEKMKTIASKINDCMRQTAKVRELTAIASKTQGLSSLLEAHRRLIRDSVITVSRKGVGKQTEIDSNKAFYASSTEKMQFILFNDLLVYVPKAKMHDPIKFGQQVPLHLVWMTSNRVPNQFDIFVPGFQFTLQFDEKKQMGECANWISDFTKTVDEHLKRYWKDKMEGEIEATKKKMTELKIDSWVPDVSLADLNSEFPIRYGKYSFHDSATFQGWFSNGVATGFGTYALHGNEYEGLFDDGLQSGLGRCRYYTGDSYFGHWSGGLPNGCGLWVSGSNDRYEGEFQNNRKHGKGEIVWNNGDKFSGQFVDDEPNGYGELIFGRGLIYHGEFESGMFHGKGILIAPTGKNYSGDWVRNERCGNGILKYSDGSFYAGRWLDNKFNGSGTFYNSSDGCTYVGEFNKGSKEGEGTILYRDGSYYSGQFKNDRRHGKGSYTIPDTLSYIGGWRKDSFNGAGKVTRANGVSFEGTFDMGLLNGNTSITLPGSKEKVNMHPSHISDPRLSFECPPRASNFNAHVEFAL